jgi:hypothetical protein
LASSLTFGFLKNGQIVFIQVRTWNSLESSLVSTDDVAGVLVLRVRGCLGLGDLASLLVVLNNLLSVSLKG